MITPVIPIDLRFHRHNGTDRCTVAITTGNHRSHRFDWPTGGRRRSGLRDTYVKIKAAIADSGLIATLADTIDTCLSSPVVDRPAVVRSDEAASKMKTTGRGGKLRPKALDLSIFSGRAFVGIYPPFKPTTLIYLSVLVRDQLISSKRSSPTTIQPLISQYRSTTLRLMIL